MMRSIAALCIALTALPAASQAFTCDRFRDLAEAFRDRQASDRDYVVVYGSMSANVGAAQRVIDDGTEVINVPARFTGEYLTAGGFVDGLQVDVTIITCDELWCAPPPNTNPAFYFLHLENGAYSQAPFICDSFSGSVEDNKALLLRCATGGTCR